MSDEVEEIKAQGEEKKPETVVEEKPTETVVENQESGDDDGDKKPPVEAAAVEPEPKPEPVKQDWRDRRIAQLTAKLNESKKAQAQEQSSVGGPQLTEAEIERRVREETSARVAFEQFNRACDDEAEIGRKAFPDFQKKINDLSGAMMDRNDPESVGAYNMFVAAALETGEAHKVLYALGGDLDEAARIMALNPLKRAVEMTKLALREPAAETKAPKPITPLGAKGAPHTSIDPDDPSRSDHLTTREWMRRREAQIAEQRRVNGR